MTRQEILRTPFTKESKLIEVGASYNPIIPKADGWNTTIIDHADQAALRIKYKDHPTVDAIEPVDVVWTGQSLDAAIPEDSLGTYDGLIASHVGEHMIDPIGFLQSVDRVLKPSGIIVLALPDKRVCFDFFRPNTTTGGLLEAHHIKQPQALGQIFDTHAYYTHRMGTGAWQRGQPLNSGAPEMIGSLASGLGAFTNARDQPTTYHDAHRWVWTPTSFQLSMIELYQLGEIPWTISRINQADGVEFYVWLERRTVRLPEAECEAERYRLVLKEARETATDTLLQLTERAEAPPQTITVAPTGPRIAAIIPLYNGGWCIATALTSIMQQTLPPTEVIVVNDGSTDNGPEVVEQLRKDHPDWPLLMVSRANGGQSAARNTGAQHATCDWLAFLDQDDSWYPVHLEELYKPFRKRPNGPPLGVVYSDLDHASAEGMVIQRNYITTMPHAATHPKPSVINCIERDMYILPSAALILRKAFDEVGGFDANLMGYEDDDLFTRIFHLGYGQEFISKPLSKWCIHPNSSSYSVRMRRSRNYYTRKLLKNFPDDPFHRHIFYSRDLILPRFYPHALHEVKKALQDGDLAAVAETKAALVELLEAAKFGILHHMNERRAHFVARVLRGMSPKTMMRLYRARAVVRPVARRMLFRR